MQRAIGVDGRVAGNVDHPTPRQYKRVAEDSRCTHGQIVAG